MTAALTLVARLVDITTLKVDGIVNAANEMLAPGGVVRRHPRQGGARAGRR
jgi:O-acetyl-ADP-ribose deacetylase (regulator of RNase III)